MSFAWPLLLWLLSVPLGLLIWELTRTRRAADLAPTKILRAEAGADSLDFSSLDTALPRRRLTRSRVWLWTGIALALVALARPQWGRIDEPVFDQSREIILAVDLSRSMLTPDVKPSRLDRAKLLIQSLLERLAGERIGLIVFSGTAFLQSPLSADYEILREFLPNLGPDYLPEGGTNYTALIQTAVTAFNHSSAADRFLIILSDGEATDDTWRGVADELKKKAIRVLSLGIGTATGSMIPDGTGGFMKDERGAVVLSKLEPNTLRELATLTGGTYRDASAWVDLAALVQSTVEAGQKGQFVEKSSVRLVERYQWPLAAALAALLLSFWREYPVHAKPRNLRPAHRAAVAALVLLVGALSSIPQASAAAVLQSADPAPRTPLPTIAAPQPPVPAPAQPPAASAALSKIVTRLSAQSGYSGRDWADLARDTITWGGRLQTDQQPVPPGPVNDALAAVAVGSSNDPKTADWPLLRRQLEDLLRKPDEPPPKDEDKQQQNKDDQQKQDEKQQQKDEQSQSQKPSDKSSEKGERKDSPDNKNDKPEDGKQGQNAFGDMQDKPPAPPPPPPGSDTQKVGGTPDKKPDEGALDPNLAMPLQKLDQLRNQDSPAKLFKLMQGDSPPSPAKKGKNW